MRAGWTGNDEASRRAGGGTAGRTEPHGGGTVPAPSQSNIEFSPSLLAGEEGIARVAQLVRS
jgi:hypothetical protein